MLAFLLCLSFPALLLYAAYSDLRSMEIMNWVSIVLALLFVPAAAAAGFTWVEIGQNLVFGCIVLGICAVLFYLGVFGGGDAKVIAAASVWTGMAGTGHFVFYMALAGGILAAVLIVLRRAKVQSESRWAKRLLSAEEGAPYAVAIAAGALLAAPYIPILSTGMSGVVA